MWTLKKKNGLPIYQSIIELILRYIQTGKLLPGEKLPSERKLAEYFQVNRSTVVHALDELVALGWVIRKQGSGTIVNEGKWGIATNARTDWHHYLQQNSYNKEEPFLEKIHQLLTQNSTKQLDLYTGELPLSLIPSFDLPAFTWNQFLLEEKYQDELGYLPLRTSICQMLEKEYDLTLASDSLLITSGAQQALFLVLQTLLRSGDSVAVENPSFLYSLAIFQAAGIRLYGVDMDEDGICLDHLEQLIRQKRVKMVMVSPTFQNPTGKTMSNKRKEELIKLCQKYQLPILEDDVFGQLRSVSSKEVLPLKKLDPDNVIYVGSLSKILGSTTKIGWLSAPFSVSKQLAKARMMMDFSLSIFPQVLATLALNDPRFQYKIDFLKKEVNRRVLAVYQLIDSLDHFKVTLPKGGFYLWVSWKYGSLSQKEWQLFLQEELLIAPSFFFSEERGSFRLNCSRISDNQLPILKEKLHNISLKIINKNGGNTK